MSLDKYNYILSSLEKKLRTRRFIHSIGVAHTAVTIAYFQKYDLNKVAITALLHDCAKELPPQTLDDYVIKSKAWDPAELEEYPGIKHSPAGKYLAETKYQITDPEILDAITYHSTGRPDPTELLKIIMISDYMEPTRAYSECRKNLVRIARYNLDEALIEMVESKCHYLKNVKQRVVHPLMINMLKSLKK